MKVQIYTVQSAEEALELVNLDIDHLGVTPASRGLPGEISIKVAKDICRAVEDKVVTVALSVESEVEKIIHMVNNVSPQILHLCGPEGSVPPERIREIRSKLVDQGIRIKIMQAISVLGRESIDLAVEYEKVSDYLILDTQSNDVFGIGASGNVHDWNISKQIVDAVNIPVILAGGLSVNNVKEAIHKVNPWGVDSLTHTNKILNNGGFVKDIDKVKDFVSTSKEA